MVNYDPLATDPVVHMTDRELGKYLRFGFRLRSFCKSMK